MSRLTRLENRPSSVDERLPGEDSVRVGEGLARHRPRIVVVGHADRGPRIAEVLPRQLYDVLEVGSAEDLFALLRKTECDLIVVDSVVGDLDGVSLLKSLRPRGDMPHLLVRSETDEEIDCVLALELGADDCVASSCGTREIRARVGALMRRRHNDEQTQTMPKPEVGSTSRSELVYAGWVVNRDRCQLYSPNSDVISLTNVEYGILTNLFNDPGTIRDRSSLRNLDADVCEYDHRSIDVFVSRLRKKMGKYGGQDLIETVRGRGYRLAILA